MNDDHHVFESIPFQDQDAESVSHPPPNVLFNLSSICPVCVSERLGVLR